MTDGMLAFKLITLSNLSKTDYKLVFNEVKWNLKDGKVYQRTKEAIRICYNAKALGNIKENKTLVSGKKETDSEDQFHKTLTAKGWKVPKIKYTKKELRPYKFKFKWVKCKWCRCKCKPSNKRCDCPRSDHSAEDCPNKPKMEGEEKEKGTMKPLISNH